MKPQRLFLVLTCFLMTLPLLGCGSQEPPVTKSPPPARPTLTPPSGPGGPSGQPEATQPRSPQPTDTRPAQPTTRPSSDPSLVFFERDYGSQGMAVDHAFITHFGDALIVQVAQGNDLQYQVINFTHGWEAAFTNPTEYMLMPSTIAVTADSILVAGYEQLGSLLTLYTQKGGSDTFTTIAIDNPDAGVISTAFSPDGANLAVGYASGEVRIYRTSDGTQQRAFAAHTGWVMSLFYSPDGRYLLTDGESFDSNTYIYNASTGARGATLVTESWNPVPPVFSPDGSRVAAVNDTGTLIFNTNGWTQVGTTLSIFGGEFTCDGSAFLLDMYNLAEIYSIETGELVRTLDYGSIACLSDGRAVAIDIDDPAYLLVTYVEP